MDKNNDIRVNKVDKWCEGVADVSLLQAKKSVDMFLCCYSPMLSIEALDAVRTIYVYLDEALDHFNELEARHQKDTGMISEYEEENKKLKGYLDIKRDECDDLISRVIRQDIEYAKLETKNDDKDDALKKMIKEVTELEKEKIELENRLTQEKRKDTYVILRNHNTIYDLKAEIRGLESELKQVIELAKSYGIIIHDERKDAIPDNVASLGMCGHYYVVGGRVEEESKDIQKLVDKIKQLEKKNEELSSQVSNLKIENNNLTTDTKRLNDAVEAWFNMFDDMRHKRDLLKKEYKKLKETNKSCPVACECENFKPKVHHSYDPLDDLPDVEHS